MSDYRPNIDDVDYYDCGDRHDTLEAHPTDPTRYIKCHNGRAADMACPPDGKGGYLVWDQAMQVCNFAK